MINADCRLGDVLIADRGSATVQKRIREPQIVVQHYLIVAPPEPGGNGANGASHLVNVVARSPRITCTNRKLAIPSSSFRGSAAVAQLYPAATVTVAVVPGAPRRRLSPLAGRLLWELEEAGADEVTTLRATFPEVTAAEIEATVLDLSRQGLVYVEGDVADGSSEVVLTEAGRQALTE
ncbi:MAG TPA: hypothetical protein VM938_11145 [Acidimicrobiales bacterium]|nr:hypothetical protein [Acidimicrobiales bacterium]